MANEILQVRSGESMPFEFDLNGDSLNGWVMTIGVKQFPTDVSAITERVITPDGTTWPGFLTSTETASLVSGTLYRLIGTAVNASTVEEEQFTQDFRFKIAPSWN